MLSKRKSIYLNLIKEIAISDFKLHYQGSLLGYLWSLIKPLLLFGVLYLVFSFFLRFDIEHYNLYLLLGIILWGYLADGTSSAIKNLANKSTLITRVYFPRTIIVIASTLTSLLTLLLNLIIFAIFLAFSKATPAPSVVLFPLFLIELYFIVLGLSFLISALNLKFRDLSHIWEILLQVGFWITPIIYSISMIPVKYHFWLYMNPLARIIQYSREVLIFGHWPDWRGIMGSVLLTIIIFFVGYLVFKKREPYFAEEV